jgi:hypothetical protein
VTTIANCRTLDEAEALRTFLESMGIAVFLPDETAASVVPHHFITKSGVRVQVLEDRADEARLLIESRHGTED